MKVKSKGAWSFGTKLGLPAVILSCIFSFLAGFFGSTLLSQDISDTPLLETIKEGEYNSLPYGESGDEFLATIPFQILSWKPRALYFPNFATAEQCQSIIKIAKASLAPSTLALRKGETAENTKGIRTSSGTFISASEDKTGILDLIEEKIATATMIPKTHGEVASFLLYLSNVEEGGETMFPYENGSNMDDYDFRKCTGLKVKPRQGDGLLFYSLFPNGTIDPTSLHGSCAVVKGEKWVATKWIRDQEQED